MKNQADLLSSTELQLDERILILAYLKLDEDADFSIHLAYISFCLLVKFKGERTRHDFFLVPDEILQKLEQNNTTAPPKKVNL